MFTSQTLVLCWAIFLPSSSAYTDGKSGRKGAPKQVEKLIEVYNATAKKPPVGATIAAALAKVQGRLHSVKKDRDVEVETRTGGKYKFRYATLAAI